MSVDHNLSSAIIFIGTAVIIHVHSRGPMEKALRILMLEANPEDAWAVESELRNAGIEFSTLLVETRKGFEAGLVDFKPDMVFSDYWLPDFDGVSALEIVQEEYPDIPFIFVSSAMGEELIIDAIRNGAMDYVPKVSLSRLGPAVRKALREAQARRERGYTEALLLESEAQLKIILDSVATGVLIIDPDTHTIVDANPAALHMIGFIREGIIGQPCFGLACLAEPGSCPVTDLSEEMTGVESEFRRTSGEHLTVLKTVTRIMLEGREHLLESLVDISASKKMERALREGEDTARSLLNVPIGSAAMIDQSGALLAINETGAHELGKPAEELIGADLVSLFPAELAPRRKAAVEKVIETGEAHRFEDQLDGTYYDNHLFPLFDAENRVNRVVFFVQDITERRLVEEAQKKDRDFISKVLDTAGALVLVRESGGRVVLFNRTAEDITGYKFEEIAGNTVWDAFLDAADQRKAMTTFGKLLLGHGVGGYEEAWKTRRGESRLLSLSSVTLQGTDGEVEYVITTGIDITESRVAEARLKESEERYRTVFESTGTAMCIVNAEARITFLNHEFERITGYAADDLVNKAIFTDFLAGGGGESFHAHQEEIRRGGGVSPKHFECSFRASDGKILHMLANLGFMPVLDSSAVSLIDITREKEYEEDLRERAERLRDFLVVASHELRHPISIVKGYAHTLMEYMDTMPKELIDEVLRDVEMSTDRLTRYVEQLLDISRIEQGRVIVAKQSMDPEELVETAIEGMKVMAYDNIFKTRVADGSLNVNVDPEKFVQLLNILIDNAAKFSPPGSEVDVETERSGDMLVVSVLDRGDGVPEDAREKVFDRFFQVADAAHHSKIGLGLGLHIAKQIAEAHGGTIWIEPRQGGGSIFRFTVDAG